MPTIFSLPNDVVAQIAAGEVIERPSFAVKELVDNAIDAQAHRISIDLTDGGITQIIVQDDGIGMSKEDIHLAWQLHTTSKVRTIEDLQMLHTQGFRGEALASIASVATLTIESKTADTSLGYQITVEQQREIQKTEVGMPTGTRVIVDAIFQSLPARQKFLRSAQTELRHTVQIITNIALAYPQLHFILRNNRKTILDLAKAKDLLSRLEQIFDEQLTTNLFPLAIQESYVTLHGFIAHPSQAQKAGVIQHTIINNRPVTDRLIAQTIKDCMRELLPADKQVPFFLVFSLPPELIDINIHPRKEFVSFLSPETIRSSLEAAIFTTVSKYDLTFSSSLSTPLLAKKITQTKAGEMLKAHISPNEPKMGNELHFSQLHKTYLVTEVADGILFLDQHAAHERILYEECKTFYSSQEKKVKTQTLSSAIIMSLRPQDTPLIEEHLDLLSKAGFSLQINSTKKPTLLIKSVPALLSDRNPIPILQELFEDLESGKSLRSVDSLTHLLFTYVACRSAVKAGDSLSQEQMQEIYTKLQQTPNKYTCPHGRPTTIHIPLLDIEKMFGRR